MTSRQAGSELHVGQVRGARELHEPGARHASGQRVRVDVHVLEIERTHDHERRAGDPFESRPRRFGSDQFAQIGRGQRDRVHGKEQLANLATDPALGSGGRARLV